MSQLPLNEVPAVTPEVSELVLLMENLDDAPISAIQVATWMAESLLCPSLHTRGLAGDSKWRVEQLP